MFRFLQNAEQNNTINKRKTLKQITPPPESPNMHRRLNIKQRQHKFVYFLYLENQSRLQMKMRIY